MARAARWIGAGFVVAAGTYAAHVARAWAGYGQERPARTGEEDPLLDRFLPRFDIVERHHVGIAAPPAVVLDAAREADVFEHPVVRGIIKAREVILGAAPTAATRPRGLLASALSMGWAVLAEDPGREVIVGAVTRPWEANVTFRPVPPETFATFGEPGYVKIAWTLRADPAGDGQSIFRTETRAVATDETARTNFRPYWAFLSPGIILIRWMMLGPLKADAERRVRRR